MATVLEVCTTEEQRSCVRFWGGGGANDSVQGIFIKKFFLFTVGSVCREKQFTTASRNVAKVSLMAKWLKGRSGRAETTVKILSMLCVFRRTGKAMGQAFQCWWRIYRETNVFSKFDYHMIYVLYPFVTYLLSLVFPK
jgi:hypothetical protein